MKQTFVIATLLLASCQGTQPRTPHLDAMYGVRDLEGSSTWEQTDEQNNAVGVHAEFAAADGFGPELGYIHSSGDSNDPRYVNRGTNSVKTTVRELYVGVRQNYMVNNWWQLSVSGGASVIKAKTDVDLNYVTENYSDNDTNIVPYAQLGTRAFFTDELTGGVSYRYYFLDENANLFVTNPELDGGLLMFSIGYSF